VPIYSDVVLATLPAPFTGLLDHAPVPLGAEREIVRRVRAASLAGSAAG